MDKELEKFFDEFLAGSPDPLMDALDIVKQIHHHQIVLLQAEIADLKQKIKGLEGKNDV